MQSQDLVTIGQGSQNAVIKAPLESVDLADWFFTLTDGDYRSCSAGHDGMVWIGGPGGVFTTKPKVTWELKVAAVSEESCMLACNVTVQTGDAEFLGILRNLPPSDSDPLQEHWIGETPLFAADIEKKALSGMFGK
jgi:hypothetical protein